MDWVWIFIFSILMQKIRVHFSWAYFIEKNYLNKQFQTIYSFCGTIILSGNLLHHKKYLSETHYVLLNHQFSLVSILWPYRVIENTIVLGVSVADQILICSIMKTRSFLSMKLVFRLLVQVFMKNQIFQSLRINLIQTFFLFLFFQRL